MGLSAERREVEPDHVMRVASRVHGTPLRQRHIDIGLPLPARQRSERLGHLRQGGVVVTHKVDSLRLQLAQAVVGAGIEVHHLHGLLDECDRRQELAALQAIRIQLVRRAVGGGDQHHALGLQALQQTAQQHGIGDVTHMELVEAEQLAVAGKIACDGWHRVDLAGVSTEHLVDMLHEAVEMPTLLARDVHPGKERVHHEALAAADATPEIQPRDRLGPPQTRHQPVPCLALEEFRRQVLKGHDGTLLRSIELYAVATRMLAEKIGAAFDPDKTQRRQGLWLHLP